MQYNDIYHHFSALSLSYSLLCIRLVTHVATAQNDCARIQFVYVVQKYTTKPVHQVSQRESESEKEREAHKKTIISCRDLTVFSIQSSLFISLSEA